jgi:dsDNA-specific endonuclease/ATPase MutS2
MKFQIGQKVAYLREPGYGKILELKDQQARVEDEYGFDRWLPLNSLVYIHSGVYKDEDIVIEKTDLEQETIYREFQEKTGQKKPATVWEIDLHIEELLESTRGMSNTEILLKQMKEFRTTFKKAKQKHINKLIVIHGIGEGVLKNEIRTYLSQQDQIEVYDADFSAYGKGATAVEFHPNW